MKNGARGDNYLPDRIKTYLLERGLTAKILEDNSITWDGERIVIPVFDKDGIWLFNKYRRDPSVTFGPKYTYDAGATSVLYGANKIADAAQVIICEGEFDSLILATYGYVSVSSTGGAGTFKQEWLEAMGDKELFLCFDNDDAGRKGAERITKMRPEIKTIWLPHEVGDHGDLTDYFVKLGKVRKDFEILIKGARPIIVEIEKSPPTLPRYKRRFAVANGDLLARAKEVSLDSIIKFNRQKFARCPFHEEKTASLHWFGANRWKCFGCGDSGDGVDLVMRMRNISMKDAIDYLLHI